ncbi:MAG: cupin domain-containing protein [Deltaproteobacteria bacterium]|nr:cupin domain-containing protein [Deltaproteobacteria bacterium]MBW1920147.1 cupin domain-containing protein [Deltaproteobacteria bacterium]MBW1932983.1 cupin domain-containing protein [Deltaproteobacteria bacterium]MBW1978786.1 cupin domain-containing protein [Deltaproteobacteria bacterium]MBW2045943.1 cupin domain-containing protein [Deltaproteobacteria bacterium]
MEEIYVDCNEMEWTPSMDYPEGTMVKILRDYEGKKTILLKLPPGFKMEAHSHVSVEQHYVLEGQYEVEGHVYGPATYQLFPPGYTHGPFTSEKGALVLVIWDPMQ